MNQQNTSHFDSQPQQDVADFVEVRSATDVVFAWLAVLIGYLFCRVFPVMFHPFGGLLFIFGLFAVTFIVLGCKKASFGVSPIVFSISALLLAPTLLLSSNALFHFLVFTYAVLVWFYLVYAATGNTLEKGLSDLLFIDFFKAIFIMPFSSLGKIFSTMFGGKGNKGGKNLLKVVLGIIITVIPTAVILILLSYDEAFVALFNKVFELKLTNVFSHGISLVLGVPVGMFLYSAYYAGLNKRCARIITAGGSHDTSSAFKLVPTLTAITATLPILLIYCVFFASQWQYYISAFTGALPETTTFAEYARSGFFQLCIVSVINLLIIIALQFFVSRSDGRTATSTRILCVVFSAATLILIATAVAKLSLYINRYGLTPLRVYAGWFMITLAVLFIFVVLKQVFTRFKLIPAATLVCVVLFAVLALSGSDSLIARYNVNRYLDGTLNSVDVDAMKELGDAAVPHMVRLAKDMDSKNGTDIARFDKNKTYEDALYQELGDYLYDFAERKPYTVFSMTLPRLRADKALADAGIEKVTTELLADYFSFDEVTYDATSEKVKTADFVNEYYSYCGDAKQAVKRAERECTVFYNHITVAEDPEAGMWRICFCVKGDTEIAQTVYLNDNGITKLIIYG